MLFMLICVAVEGSVEPPSILPDRQFWMTEEGRQEGYATRFNE